MDKNVAHSNGSQEFVTVTNGSLMIIVNNKEGYDFVLSTKGTLKINVNGTEHFDANESRKIVVNRSLQFALEAKGICGMWRL